MKKEGVKKTVENLRDRMDATKIEPLRVPRTFGQKAADKLTAGMGSWMFILIFILVLIVWVAVNGYYIEKYLNEEPFDPFPFILLNLFLSCLAAIQAPIILMSQNRQSQKDRVKAEYDYNINKKAEIEIRDIKKQLERIEKNFLKKKKK